MMKHLGFLWKEIYLFAVWTETEVPELPCLGRNLGILRACLRASVSHSWLSPTSAWGRVAAGRDQGTNCRKISYQCQWCRKENWGKWLITVVERSQVEFLQGGVTVALHNPRLFWQSREDSIPSACGWQFVVWCGEVLEGGTWAIMKGKKNITINILISLKSKSHYNSF